MKKSILAALVMGLVAGLATTAEARVEQSSMPRAESSLTKSGMSRNFKANGHRHASKAKRTRVARRSNSGGGASRGCLTAAARGLLNRIESKFGPVSIVSTCRPGAVIATTGKPSKHRNGQAIDFDAGSRKGAIVQWLIANHHSGGTMTYRDMGHIHVDVGYRFVKLGAHSGHG